MNVTRTPEGAAGEDTRFAIEESVNSHLERMFMQAAKNDALGYSVGRTSDHGTGLSEHRRFEALRAECDAAVSFHAGRALDLALQLVFAVASDQIFGRASRENPKAEPDRYSHDLHHLNALILKKSSELGGVGRDLLAQTLEHAYQTALHRGVVDVVDKNSNIIGAFVAPENQPFRTVNWTGLSVGAELTMDDSNEKPWFEQMLRPDIPTAFKEMSLETFRAFLKKADKSYFGEVRLERCHNMRSHDYRARDTVAFNPCARAGTAFFGRLCKEIVMLAAQHGIWHKRLADREGARGRRNAMRTIVSLIDGTFRADDAAKIRAVAEKAQLLKPGFRKPNLPDQGEFFYAGLHRKFFLEPVGSDADEAPS